MSSYKQTKWSYKPLSDRRREDGDIREPRASSSADIGTGRSSRTPVPIQRSASLAYQHQDLLSSQIKDFLQRTDRSSKRSKSRSVDTPSKDKILSRSAKLSPSPYYKSRDVSVSSRDNSIWEEGEESEGGTEIDEACSSLSSDKSDIRINQRLSKEIISEKYTTNNLADIGRRSESKSFRLSCRSDSVTNHGELDDNDYIPKHRYESLKKHYHSVKTKMSQQHDMEVDKLLSLKKQLEKKLYDTYESLDEQKQIACQWKKKYAKLSSELSELKLQFDDHLSQKFLIEKKRRKEESEFQYLLDELNKEKKTTDKLIKEKEIVCQEKTDLEEIVNDLRCDIQMKSSKIKSLSEDLNGSKNSMTDVELENCKNNNSKLKKMCLQLEEELENSLRQADSLEEARYKMEQNMDRLRKEHKQEISQKDEELDDLRHSLEKKMKMLQCQLEQEHHEKNLIMKEKYKLERQMDDMQDSVSQSQSNATSLLGKMKNKLIKTRALLKDERTKEQSKTKETNNKVLLRKLKNQLDGVELEKMTAIKTKQKYELEYSDLANNMADLEKNKMATEKKLEEALKEINNQHKLVDDKEEELNEVIKRFTSTTQQLTDNQTVIQEMTEKISNIELENSTLLQRVATLQVKLDNMDSLTTSSSKLQAENFKAKVKELESRNELDKAMISRRELQLSQLNDKLERAMAENDKAQQMLNETAREVKSFTRQIKDLQEETKKLSLRESDLLMRNKDLALKIEAIDAEKNMAFAELRLANERITTLKQAMDDSTSCISDSSTESVDGTTISMATLDDFKYRSESPDTMSAISEGDINETVDRLDRFK